MTRITLWIMFVYVYAAQNGADAKDAFSSPWAISDTQQLSSIAYCVLSDYGDKIPKDRAVLYLRLKAFPDHPRMAKEPRASPWLRRDNVSQHKTPPSSFMQMPAYMALRVYQSVISPTKGHYCPTFPSCSAYSVQAMRQYGVLQGLVMTADRLHRCGHDVQQYALVETPGGTRYEDPVHVNTPSYYRRAPHE